MASIMEKIFGASWKTSLLGICQAIVTAALAYFISVATNSEPITWAGFGLAILQAIKGFFQKDYDVSTKTESNKGGLTDDV